MNPVTARLRAGALGAIVAVAVTVPAYAADAERPGEGSKQSDIGALTGLAVGAAAGGPVGALIGMGAGAVLGDHYHRQQKAKQALAADLRKSEAERTSLKHDVGELGTSLAAAQAQDAQLGETLKKTDQLGLDVSFRTDDSEISAQALAPLMQLGALAVAMPQATVRVAGFADPRGSEEYNDALSLKRAQAVAAVLASAGVPASRVVIEARGKSESQSEQGDLDGYALERRVTVRLELTGASQVAARD
jgi:outer membrane protein OmpA-like peptidoglycan-associated protein